MKQVASRISPEIDSVIRARIESMVKAEINLKADREKYPFMTISREYGCEGYGVACAIEKIFNVNPREKFPWVSFDKEILERIAEESGQYPGLVKMIMEQRLSAIGHLVIDMVSDLPNEYDIFQKMAKTIAFLAHKGRAILIGRGSSIITKDIERGVHIRITAPLDYRVERIAKLHSISRDAAEKEVRHMQAERETFVQKFTMHSVADLFLYHLIFNNALCTVDEMASITVDLMRGRKWI